MASSLLCFDLYSCGTKITTSTFTVYLDSSTEATENATYKDECVYQYRQLTGSGSYSAFTSSSISANEPLYRIRIMSASNMKYCTSWFKKSTNGYGDYITYYGSNGPNNGIYRIPMPATYFGSVKSITGSTSLSSYFGVDFNKNKTIPCDIYIYWGGSFLTGGTTYPSCVGMDSINLGETYSISVPPSSTISNNGTYRFDENSYVNDYGLVSINGYVSYNNSTATTLTRNLDFLPHEDVICTGKMAEAISYYGNETYDNLALRGAELSALGFSAGDGTGNVLNRFYNVKKKNSITFNTVFLANGTVNNVAYEFSGNSTDTVRQSINFPASTNVSGCTWKTTIYGFLGTNYTTRDLNKSVIVGIGGYISSISGWYYKVVAYDSTVIKNTSLKTSSNETFTTTIGRLDGATIFFSRSSSISNTSWGSASKATDGSKNILSDSNEYSWSSGGGTSTTSLDSIGEFD